MAGEMALPEFTANVEPADARQTDVQQEKVEFVVQTHFDRFVAIRKISAGAGHDLLRNF
jgi:hypothetical protein